MEYYFLSLSLGSPPPAAPANARRQAALAFARRAHTAFRLDGQPAVSHPIAVEQILRHASPDLPENAYIAALLHDVLEDTHASLGHLWHAFGQEVSDVVWALTRPFALPESDPLELEQLYLEQMTRVHGTHPYTLAVKLADRVHNVETVASLPEHRRLALLHETETLYLPVFHACAAQAEGAVQHAMRTLFARLQQSLQREREQSCST